MSTSISTPSRGSAGLDLALIGNCSFGALIDQKSCIKWCCLPRFDGDPIFCSLLRKTNDLGFYEIFLENFSHSKQYYIKNTAVLVTEMYSKEGDSIEITDFAPMFAMYGRTYRPIMLIRTIKPTAGHPRIRARIRPTFGYGWGAPEKTRGTNHIRYLLPNFAIRLTTNAPISYVVDEILFEVNELTHFVLMPDESLKESPAEIAASSLQKTVEYWQNYTSILSIPFEWQEQVIRSCITIKMCSFEETGSILAAITSSIPLDSTSAGYDLRYCWLQDSSNIIHTLNKLGSTKNMEDFLTYISNIVAGSDEQNGNLQPVYGIALETRLYQKDMHRMAGYKGLGPVRVGTDDYKLIRNDVYGHIIMSITQVFFDHRLRTVGDKKLFSRLEHLGERAFLLHDQPDAGPHAPSGTREDSKDIHTYSAVMCWAAVNRLEKIARALGLEERAQFWFEKAAIIHDTIMAKAWNQELNSFTDTFGGSVVDVFLLLMPDVGFIPYSDAKFLSTLDRIFNVLVKGKLIIAASQALIGHTKNVSNTYNLWYVIALASAGRNKEARELFEFLISKVNHVGLLGETMNPETGEQWGNFPKTTSMVGLIEGAIRLSKRWDEVV